MWWWWWGVELSLNSSPYPTLKKCGVANFDKAAKISD